MIFKLYINKNLKYFLKTKKNIRHYISRNGIKQLSLTNTTKQFSKLYSLLDGYILHQYCRVEQYFTPFVLSQYHRFQQIFGGGLLLSEKKVRHHTKRIDFGQYCGLIDSVEFQSWRSKKTATDDIDLLCEIIFKIGLDTVGMVYLSITNLRGYVLKIQNLRQSKQYRFDGNTR